MNYDQIVSDKMNIPYEKVEFVTRNFFDSIRKEIQEPRKKSILIRNFGKFFFSKKSLMHALEDIQDRETKGYLKYRNKKISEFENLINLLNNN